MQSFKPFEIAKICDNFLNNEKVKEYRELKKLYYRRIGVFFDLKKEFLSKFPKQDSSIFNTSYDMYAFRYRTIDMILELFEQKLQPLCKITQNDITLTQDEVILVLEAASFEQLDYNMERLDIDLEKMESCIIEAKGLLNTAEERTGVLNTTKKPCFFSKFLTKITKKN